MPYYDYYCGKCDQTRIIKHAITDEQKRVCEQCGTALKKTYSLNAVTFRGKGFYSTDKNK